MVSFDDFSRLKLKIGKIIEINNHPDAEKLYVLKVDIGEKMIQLVAGIKPFYNQDDLIGKLIIVLTNLEPKDIRGVVSEGMLLAAHNKDNLSVLVPDKQMEPGSLIR